MAVISAAGMISPVGREVLQTFTSIRAHLTRKGAYTGDYLCAPDDPDFEKGAPPVVSAISYLKEDRNAIENPAQGLAFLAAQAFDGMMAEMPEDKEECANAGLFLSLPPSRPEWGPLHRDDFWYHFHNYAQIDPLPVEEFSWIGHTGAHAMMESALVHLRTGKIRSAFVGGVESYLFDAWLAELDDAWRLKSDRNVDGFIPGEGAAFVCVENDGKPQRSALTAQVKIEKIAKAQCSPAQILNNTGVDLSKLIAAMIDSLDEAPVFLCDLNGEPARMREWGYVLSRLGKRLGDPCLIEHPADVLGDVGASSGAMLAALAPLYLTKKYPQKKRALLWTASDTGERSALLLSLLK